MKIASILFVSSALVYWSSLWTPGFPGDWAVKAFPMLVAAVVLGKALPVAFGVPFVVGFLAAAAGDVFLALDRHDYLMQGLLCFLVTQLAYSYGFIARQVAVGERLLYRLPVAVYSIGAFMVMLPSLGSFLVPVAVYVGALMTMGVLAAGVENKPGRLYLGAVLFVIADSLIGINRFVSPFAYSEPIIVGIYTTGQFLIFTGALAAFGSRAVSGRMPEQ
ncbi:MAG: lysoplasmalogenase [Wenzhouxiangella sp.]|nr:lysoplasmalogenase [Wenzhouxiangella sp.]